MKQEGNFSRHPHGKRKHGCWQSNICHIEKARIQYTLSPVFQPPGIPSSACRKSVKSGKQSTCLHRTGNHAMTSLSLYGKAVQEYLRSLVPANFKRRQQRPESLRPRRNPERYAGDVRAENRRLFPLPAHETGGCDAETFVIRHLTDESRPDCPELLRKRIFPGVGKRRENTDLRMNPRFSHDARNSSALQKTERKIAGIS